MSEHERLVSLESYATAIACLSAGLDLPRSLAFADIPPSEWGPAGEEWQSRIDESAASDLTLLVTFDAALLAAKRRLEPAIEPITSDAAAWTSFRRHFLTAVDPLAFLAHHELSPATYARLEADWADRAAADEALAAALHRHLAGPLSDCPVLMRIPSPLLAGVGAPRLAGVGASPAREIPPPGELPGTSALAPEPLGSRPVRPPVSPLPAPPEDAAPAVALPALFPPPLVRALGRGDETLMGSLVPENPALPFDAHAPSALPPVAAPAPAPGASWLSAAWNVPARGDETLMGSLVPECPALPFDEHAPNAPHPAAETKDTPTLPWLPERGGARLHADETLAAPPVPRGPVLPLAPLAPPGLPSHGWPAVVTPGNRRPEEEVGETLMMFELSSIPVLPFDKGPRPGGMTPNAAAPRLPSIATALEADPEALDPGETTPGFPLERYAALCVELALYPAHQVEVLRRYSIDDARRRALDAFWSPRVQRNPDLRAAWDGYYVAHWRRLRDAQTAR